MRPLAMRRLAKPGQTVAPALRVVALALLVSLGGGCGPSATVAPPPPAPQGGGSRGVDAPLPPLPGARLLVVRDDTAAPDTALPVVTVEVVATHTARQRGLGGRETLAPDRGMLFVYPVSRERTFWMKDCLIGLDIAFLDDDGRILRVATLPPGAGLSGDELPSATCPGQVRYVLEVAALGLGRLGVGTGDVVDVRAAVAGVDAE